MFNVSFQRSLFPFTEDSASCLFKDNSPVKHSPSLGWDQGVISQHTMPFFKLIHLLGKEGKWL